MTKRSQELIDAYVRKKPVSPKEIRELLEDAFDFVFDMWFNYRCKGKRGKELKKKIFDALSAPRRNCDVGTIKQRAERFRKFCHCRRCHECPLCIIDGDNDDQSECIVAWGDLPYVEKRSRR